jgi:beta-lactamase superfamily II metal-dependent hydrolase
MSTIKSFSVGNGDMFYINHNTDNFSIIDCCLSDDNKERIVKEIKRVSEGKGIMRFISTHPDDDHMGGLKFFDENIGIHNFYCVKNDATKEDETDDFKHYCALRDSSKKAFYIKKDCSRRWMNLSSEERSSAGISILWPILSNDAFKEALKLAEEGNSPNNISAIIRYGVNNGASVLWMGDLETDFMEKIKNVVSMPKTDIIFAPHHGRDTGKIPEDWLKKIDPKIIIIGEAPSEDLNYYKGYNTITQNSAEDITFECVDQKVHIFVSNPDYSVDFLDSENMDGDDYYIGTLNL